MRYIGNKYTILLICTYLLGILNLNKKRASEIWLLLLLCSTGLCFRVNYRFLLHFYVLQVSVWLFHHLNFFVKSGDLVRKIRLQAWWKKEYLKDLYHRRMLAGAEPEVARSSHPNWLKYLILILFIIYRR